MACLLHDERLRGHFYSLKSLRTLVNETTPDGRYVKWQTLLTAFSRSNDLDWYFEHTLQGELTFEKGTFLAIRRVTRKGGEKGKYTAIGCFGPKDKVHGTKAIQALADNDPGLRISPRQAGFHLPDAIEHNYYEYTNTDNFSSNKRDANTPVKRQRPNSARPDSAGSGRETLQKRGRSEVDGSLPPSLSQLPKSKKEQIAELEASIANHMRQQIDLEASIAKKISALKLNPIKRQIDAANKLETTIQQQIKDLNLLQSKQIDVDDFLLDRSPERVELHYALGGGKYIGFKDLFLGRDIIFTSELMEDGIVHKSTGAETTGDVEPRSETNNSQPNAGATTTTLASRSKNKSYRARSRRARFILDTNND